MDIFDPQYYFSVKFVDSYHFTIFEKTNICNFVEAEHYEDTNILLTAQDFSGFQSTVGTVQLNEEANVPLCYGGHSLNATIEGISVNLFNLPLKASVVPEITDDPHSSVSVLCSYEDENAQLVIGRQCVRIVQNDSEQC